MKHTFSIFYCDKIIVSVCNMLVPVVPESTPRGEDQTKGKAEWFWSSGCFLLVK